MEWNVVLPALTADGLLPPAGAPYLTDMDELRQIFVDGAPAFRDERARVFTALELHLGLARERVGAGIHAWIDGGFITHKTWAAPHDADVALVISPTAHFVVDEVLPLLTLKDVSAVEPKLATARLQPMGGLVDAFLVPDQPAARATWHDTWSSVKDATGVIVQGQRKGYVEVIL
ncbi:DUF6932 family protein [Nocardioides sp.]|uniref:DUF6932 family protein n=1 Tax=Nocardioides sp. TaxID=35761 RepID=UPI0039E4DFC3